MPKQAQFVSKQELRSGDKAVLGGKIWVVTSREPLPDRNFPWLYHAEELRFHAVSEDRKSKAAGAA